MIRTDEDVVDGVVVVGWTRDFKECEVKLSEFTLQEINESAFDRIMEDIRHTRRQLSGWE